MELHSIITACEARMCYTRWLSYEGRSVCTYNCLLVPATHVTMHKTVFLLTCF